MPFLFDDDEEELKQNQNISGQSSIINPQGQKQQGPKQSGSWTNLQSYLDANQEQVAKMGETITGNVNNQAQEAKDAINSYKFGEPQKIEKTSEANIKDTLDKTNDKASYQALKAGYQGPNYYDEIEGYDNASKKFAEANQNLNKLSSEEGRQSVLADTYKRPSYSQGQKTLDNLLIQNDPSSRAMFQATQDQNKDFGSLFDDTTSQLQNSINQSKQNALQNQQLAYQTEQKYIDDFLAPLQERVENSPSGEFISGVQEDVKDTVLNQKTLEALGIDPGTYLYDLNLSDYIKYDGTTPNLDNVATQEERAKWQALQNFIDGEDSRITADGKAITPISLDKEKLLADAEARGNEIYYSNGNAYQRKDQAAGGANQRVRGLNLGSGDKVSDFLTSGLSPEEWVGEAIKKSYQDKGYNISKENEAAFKQQAMNDLMLHIKKFGLIAKG